MAGKSSSSLPPTQLLDYRFPRQFYLSAWIILVFFYVSFVPAPSLAHQIRSAVGPLVMKGAWVIFAVFHVGESAVMIGKMVEHSVPVLPASLWVATTAIFGFPAFLELQTALRKAAKGKGKSKHN